MEITLIAALASNRVIGKDDDMPWHYPEDLKHFKAHTLGKPVIMGRVTYESIVDRLGGPLPDRVSIVLTRNPDRVDTSVNESTGLEDLGDATRVHTASMVDEALAIAETQDTDEVFVAGGGSVYEQFLPVADRMVLTEIHETYEGDTKFPEWDRGEWIEIKRDLRENLAFVEYKRTRR